MSCFVPIHLLPDSAKVTDRELKLYFAGWLSAQTLFNGDRQGFTLNRTTAGIL